MQSNQSLTVKLQQKQKALELRKSGYSLKEIAEDLGISKSTASLWTKNIKTSSAGIARIKFNQDSARAKSGATLHHRKIKRLAKAEKEAEKMLAELSGESAIKYAILAMMYRCEGVKNDRSICFANSDPVMITLFLKLFRESFTIKEEKLKALVHIHDYHNDEEVKRFWSSKTKIPLDRFYKSFRKPSSHLYKKPDYQGCIHIYYHDTHLTRIILAFAKKLMNLYI